MSNSVTRSSAPLVSCDWLSALPPAARFILQGGLDARRAVSAAFGLVLPETVGRTEANNTRAALWLGPNERLLIGWHDDAATLDDILEQSLQDLPHSLVDVSHRQVALRLRGTSAANILNTGCPLDLDLSSFAVGQCTRTVFTKAEIVLWRLQADEFHLETGRSFADYVSRWMLQAGQDLSQPMITMS